MTVTFQFSIQEARRVSLRTRTSLARVFTDIFRSPSDAEANFLHKPTSSSVYEVDEWPSEGRLLLQSCHIESRGPENFSFATLELVPIHVNSRLGVRNLCSLTNMAAAQQRSIPRSGVEFINCASRFTFPLNTASKTTLFLYHGFIKRMLR